MALIRCPECGSQVSDAAPACIKCGFPFAGSAGAPGGTPAQQAPRFDGIYVSEDVRKGRGSLRIFRADYSRGYIRFFEDGLMVYGGAVVMANPGPGPFPPLSRSWGSDESRHKWSADGERLKILAPSATVSYARFDGSRLFWEGGYSRVFNFHEIDWQDH